MSFLREAFSEDDGRGSASRLMMAVHAIFVGVWGTVFVHHTHTIPDAVTMAGLTSFVTAPYAMNKIHAAVTAFIPGSK